jgi:preprotein translocase subunit YajC
LEYLNWPVSPVFRRHCNCGIDRYHPPTFDRADLESDMWITPAFAQDGGGFGGLEGILPLVLIFVVFYFLLIRPQQKRAREHREMLAALRRGDRIVTGGGIIGTVTRVKDNDELTVEIAEGVKVSVARGTVAQVISRADGGNAGSAKAGGPTVVTGSDGVRAQGGFLGNLLGGGRK